MTSQYGAGRPPSSPGYSPPGQSQDFTIAQSARLSMSVNGWVIRSVAVTNLTPFPVHFPNNPAAYQWVFPNTLNAMIPVPWGDVVQVNTIDIHPAIGTPQTSGLLAQLTAYEDVLPPSPGQPFIAVNPAVLKTAAVAGVVNGAAITVWTPAAGKRFQINGLVIASSVLGEVDVFDEGTQIGAIPVAALISLDVSALYRGYTSAAANNRLRLLNNTGAQASLLATATGLEI